MSESMLKESSRELIKNVIDSMCMNCCKRLLHFQLFTITAGCEKTNHYWIQEYLNEKMKREKDDEKGLGCAVCFGLLERFSQDSYLREVQNRYIYIKMISISILNEI